MLGKVLKYEKVGDKLYFITAFTTNILEKSLKFYYAYVKI